MERQAIIVAAQVVAKKSQKKLMALCSLLSTQMLHHRDLTNRPSNLPQQLDEQAALARPCHGSAVHTWRARVGSSRAVHTAAGCPTKESPD